MQPHLWYKEFLSHFRSHSRFSFAIPITANLRLMANDAERGFGIGTSRFSRQFPAGRLSLGGVGWMLTCDWLIIFTSASSGVGDGSGLVNSSSSYDSCIWDKTHSRNVWKLRKLPGNSNNYREILLNNRKFHWLPGKFFVYREFYQ